MYVRKCINRLEILKLENTRIILSIFFIRFEFEPKLESRLDSKLDLFKLEILKFSSFKLKLG